MARNLVYIAVAALAVLAILLGYQIYQQQVVFKQTSELTPPPVIDLPRSTDSATLQPSQQTPSQNVPSKEEIDLVKKVPSSNTSIEERIKYNEQIAKYERVAEVVEFTNCTPKPFIFKVKGESQFMIKNNDNIPHTIFVGSDKFEVVAGGTVTTKAMKADAITNLSCPPAEGGISGLIHAVE